jgi:callose synthase
MCSSYFYYSFFSYRFEGGFFWDHVYASKQLDVISEEVMMGPICKKLVGLLSVRKAAAEPSSAEARRRLTFFVNSLFMDMPSAPPVPDMNSFSVMTPFYSEDVIYTKADLETENSDGVTVLLYLQTLYKEDWRNFLERIGVKDLSQIWSKKHLMETRLWASLRAQTLARTVSGMMHYEAALRLQAQLERVQHMELEEVLRLKFSYVVAAQVYGKMKKSQDGKAGDIEWLLHRYPNLRVAYIDEKPYDRRGGANFFSCLIKSSGTEDPKIETVYRVKLPGNPCIGEGKPENQNHAVIFSRGEYMQAIDMNQDGFFEEALKHRNLLEEFKRSRKALPLTILGFREHIFTGDVSSLANYMALQEASFVTTGQRVLNRPLCIRLHYGHPDLFDKLFFMQNGGISKASKGINLSEDVFAGYANSVRGGSVEFKEYCQVGKGRDVGMMQIYKFEAKLAQGNAEQCLSRDVDRMVNRLDFPRLMSFFFGGIGHYINSTITVFTIITVTYIIAFSALFGFEKVGDRAIVILGSIQIALAGMGILQTLPLLATLTVERGLGGACAELLRVFGSGGPFYFIFHIQTRAYYFFQTLIAGGAQYRATGRGFVTRHALFDENWRFFASSHMYLGFELLGALFVFKCYTKSSQFWGHCWSMFVAAMAFIWTPYWFNPLAFNWAAVRSDYSHWLLWMNSDGGSAAHSWRSWWKEEKGYMSRLRLVEKTTVLWRAVIYIVLAVGISGFRDLSSEKIVKFFHMVMITGGSFFGLLYVDWLGGCGKGRCTPNPNALTRFLKIPLMVTTITSFAVFISRDAFLLHMCGGVYYLCAAIYTVGVVAGMGSVAELLRIHDLIWGHAMFIPLFALAALQLPDKIQTWLLYHNALSEGVLIDTILKQARRSQKAEEAQASTERVTQQVEESTDIKNNIEFIEMKRQLEEHKQLISHLTRTMQQQASQAPQPMSTNGASSNKSLSSQEPTSHISSSSLKADEVESEEIQPPLIDDDDDHDDKLPSFPATPVEARQTTLGDNLVFRGAGPVG